MQDVVLRKTKEYEQTIDSNIGESASFSVKADAAMFELLSSKQYSNKVAAVVRELGCNAYDSHVVAGKANVPFEVTLPHEFAPYFSVKDQGVGLDHKAVVEIYTVYGASTKRDDLLTTGALGIGSKSPFCMTDSFSVTAIKDGMKREYLIFKEEGIPKFNLLFEVSTTEPNGVEVKVPVDKNKWYEFRTEAIKIYTNFETKPIVTGTHGIEVYGDDVEYVISNGWGKVESSIYQFSLCVIQSNVKYNVSINNEKMVKFRGLFKNKNAAITLNVPNGYLDFASSREELEYTDRTKTNLNSAIDAFVDLAFEEIQKEIDNADSWVEASKPFYRKYYSNLRMPNAFKFKNKSLSKHYEIRYSKSNTLRIWKKGRWIYRDVPIAGACISGTPYKARGNKFNLALYVNVNTDQILVKNKTTMNRKKHDKFISEFNGIKLMEIVCSKEFFKDKLEPQLLAGIKVSYLSDVVVERTKSEYSEPKLSWFRTLFLKYSYTSNTEFLRGYDNDLPSEAKYYIVTYRNEVLDASERGYVGNINRTAPSIIAVNEANVKRAVKAGLVPLKTFIDEHKEICYKQWLVGKLHKEISKHKDLSMLGVKPRLETDHILGFKRADMTKISMTLSSSFVPTFNDKVRLSVFKRKMMKNNGTVLALNPILKVVDLDFLGEKDIKILTSVLK